MVSILKPSEAGGAAYTGLPRLRHLDDYRIFVLLQHIYRETRIWQLQALPVVGPPERLIS